MLRRLLSNVKKVVKAMLRRLLCNVKKVVMQC
jgi:hypothetical protein